MLRIVAGIFKGRFLKAPQGSSTRPTQSALREAVFNICQYEIQGTRFLDLFAGSGAMGFEALSRGALHITFVEQNRHATNCIYENAKTLQVEKQITVMAMDTTKAIHTFVKQGLQFDIIYIDPPYENHFDLSALLPILGPNPIVFLEERYVPKETKKKQEIEGMLRKDQRRFGTALLTIYVKQMT
jgi:16S rRNA (guanine966-N2)-methyltransferase